MVPQQLETTAREGLSHFGKYCGRNATFSYHFNQNLLTEIWVCINDSSERKFTRTQARLSEDFDPMSAPCQSKQDELLSRGEFDGLEVEHWLRHYEEVGLAEMIQFRRRSPGDS